MKTREAKLLYDIFEIGKNYTLFKISEWSAMTVKSEITVKDKTEEGVVFVNKGKRKKYILLMETRHYQGAPYKPYAGAVFEGFDQPITCDTDYKGSIGSPTVMRGNACYNFVGTIEAVREWIDNKQLNPNFDKSLIIAISPEKTNICGDIPETVCYPELVVEGQHAVIDELMAS